MKKIINNLVPFTLIVLFTYAAGSKLLELRRFRAQLYLQPFPHAFSDMLLYALPCIEIIAALLLAFSLTRKTGLYIALILMALFTGYISLVLFGYWTSIPCSCGGVLEHMSWTTHLIFNWCFLIATILAVAGHHQNKPDLELHNKQG